MEKNHDNSHQWLAEHGDYLYRFALARLRDPHQAEDAVQETLIAAMTSSGFNQNSSARTWLTGILKHKIIDVFRKQARETSLDVEDEFAEVAATDDFFDHRERWLGAIQDWELPDNQLEQKQFLNTLQQCVDKLPSKLAQIFIMRDVNEDDNEEICKVLDITTTNAWVMLYRARMNLRKCLEINWTNQSQK